MELAKAYDPSSDEQEIAGELIRDWGYLYSLRGNWMTHWTEIAQRIWPNDYYYFNNLQMLTTQGEKRTFELFDSTGLLALERFGAILDSLLTPFDSMWHLLKADDPALNKDYNTKWYFEKVNNTLWDQRYKFTSNFTAQNQNIWKSLGAYGTGAMFIDGHLSGVGLRYRNTHLSEVYLQENHQQIIDRVCRRFMLTARQAWLMFGYSNSPSIIEAAQKQPEKQFIFLHWVRPNYDRDPSRMDGKGMEFSSHYVSTEGTRLVYVKDRPKDQGYRMFPYAISRYEQALNEAYGRSPAMNVLPSIKTLNEQKKAMLKQGHRALDPTLLAHDDGIVDAFNFQPGAMNAGGVTADGRPLVIPLPTGQLQAGKEMMDEEKSLINDSFLVSLFQILTESPEMTATEVMERVREKGILMAPTVGRQKSEYLGPTIEREIEILSRQGLLPPMPKMLKQAKGQYKIVYDSPISRTQRAEGASGAVRSLEVFSQYSQMTGDQSSLDIINMHRAGPEIAEIYGTPAHWINSPQEIAQLKDKRQKQQIMQQTIQAGPAAAALAKAHASMGGQLPTHSNPTGAPAGQQPVALPTKPGRNRGTSPLGRK